MYDFLIVGSGLFGATFADQMTRRKYSCLIIEKRKTIGGNLYCFNQDGINCHAYGPHVFHTNDKPIWDFVNSFVPFRNFIFSPMASYHGQLYNLPFNMNTFYKIWGMTEPEDVIAKIKQQAAGRALGPSSNLEEQCISMVGTDVYNMLVKEYTEKQWQKPCSELPAFIIKRLPIRLTFDNNYFNDEYQGIPEGGYNKLISGLIGDVEVRTDTDYFANREHFNSLARRVVYTGPIDQYFDFRFGELEYRSLQFTHKIIDCPNYQGVPAMYFTDHSVPYTRIIEHKHFEKVVSKSTVITHEYPVRWTRGMEPFYPINDNNNTYRYKKYKDLAEREENVIFGGRLAEYRYYDMHQVIASAIKKAKSIRLQ